MDFKESLQEINERVQDFFTFIARKLKDFRNLSLGEQIAFPCVGLGLLMVLVSLFMFVWG